ncbi:MAG: cupin domain-containing protein [Chloroflexi bacterium]|nr:MAG: cupin domain-containing protein [Chloroflexota bacterium]
MMYVCPCCQQPQPMTKVDVIDVRKRLDDEKLTEKEPFKRIYFGHGRQSSVFVFRGHAGPFKKHKHVTHDEVGYVLAGTGSVTVGETTRPVHPGDVWIIPANTPHGAEFGDPCDVLFISSPIDDPENQDRVWID